MNLARAARAYVERLDLSLVVANDRKVPNAKFFPHGATSATQDLDLIERALRATPSPTLAARVGAHLVVDADVRSGAVERLAKSIVSHGAFPRTWEAQTPTGGVHVWFKDPGFFVRGHVLDSVELLRGNRLVTLSPSYRAGGRYCWTQHPLEIELARAPYWLLAIAKVPPVEPRTKIDHDESPEHREKRAASYMSKFDGAVSGSKGHSRTMAAATIVVRGFDLDKDAAFRVMSAWNGMCDPPWNDNALKRKITDAERHGRMAWGAKLKEKTK